MQVRFGGGQLGHIDRRQKPEDRQTLPHRGRREAGLREGPQGRQLGSGTSGRSAAGPLRAKRSSHQDHRRRRRHHTCNL